MYLVQNNHPAIVSREDYQAVQAELARRTAARSPSTKAAPTGRTSYASKYALSERLVCGECGTLYRRCTWTQKGEKRIVWRCVSRLDYGTKYCHHSPTMKEGSLQQAIMNAVNSQVGSKESVVRQIMESMELDLVTAPNSAMSLGAIKRRMQELEEEFRSLLTVASNGNSEDYTERFRRITEENARLKEQQEAISAQLHNNQSIQNRMQKIKTAADLMEHHITQWDESMIRQLVHTVEIISADLIRVVLTDGSIIMQEVHIRPRFGIWENVPGALSSGNPKTEDFRIVLEEFLRIGCDSISVPGPYTGRWESSGRILLGNSLSLAWRILDTQYWPGTPQRRRRIYLVVDFGGQSAPQILFDQESLYRDYSALIGTREATTAGVAESLGVAVGNQSQ